ncbi:MAG: DNA primase [Candidatus Babeliaceae bacterium]|nr:DNA primase [Candidatus Babeliaceae bacterium]
MDLFAYIRSHIAIEDVVREYVALKPAGAYLKGFSPFKHERTPSFTVSPGRGIYYCFSTGNGGDAVDFVSKMERCSQGEAARILIERFHLKVPENLSCGLGELDGEQRQQHRKACAFFASWCSERLHKNVAAQAYVKVRGLTAATIAQFCIGYCPGGDLLSHFLRAARGEGILPSQFEESHLLVVGPMGTSFAFEDRIIFPIEDHMGGICGFGGRVFRPGDERPKYLNSRDHEQFNKKQLLYGLRHAKKAIQAKGMVYLVEGYIDCIAMVQGGYAATVATLGTACTSEHLALLGRYARQLVVLYDGDEAGQKAIMRLTQLCWQGNLDISVLRLPKEDDPASYLEKAGNLQGLGTPQDLFTFFISTQGGSLRGLPSAQKLEKTNEILRLVAQIPDALRCQLLLQQASEVFVLPVALLQREMERLTGGVRLSGIPSSGKAGEKRVKDKDSFVLDLLEERLFSVILTKGINIREEDRVFLTEQFSGVMKDLFCAWYTSNGQFDQFIASLSGEAKAAALRCASWGERGVTVATYEELLKQVRRRYWRDQLAHAKERLVGAGVEDKRAILEEVKKLQTLMVRRGFHE